MHRSFCWFCRAPAQFSIYISRRGISHFTACWRITSCCWPVSSGCSQSPATSAMSSHRLSDHTVLYFQAWSITFHSWLTFVLLLLACIIWMFPKSRHVCYVLSPFILFYAVCLLLMQFVFGMNLSELPKEVNGIKLSDIGLKTFTYPCLQLALQVRLSFYVDSYMWSRFW